MSNDEYSVPIARTILSQAVLENRGRIVPLLAPGVEPAQFIASCVHAADAMALSNNEMNDRRTMGSFVKTVRNCAVVGLLPGDALGHAYFVPYTFYRHSPKEHVIVNLVVGYRGFLELAWASQWLVSCSPEVVLSGEECATWHETAGPQVKHIIPRPRQTETDSSIVGAYCTYTPRHGVSTVGEYIEGSELKELARKAGGRSPWKTNYSAMCKKTAVRRSSKMWRLTRQMAWAVELDEQDERGEVQDALISEEERDESTFDLDDLPKTESEE